MFVITLYVDSQFGATPYYFAGWDGPHHSFHANELMFWAESIDHSSTYSFSSLEEATIEAKLIRDSKGFPIGIPENATTKLNLVVENFTVVR